MKRILLFFALFIVAYTAQAQRNIQMRNMWHRPQVHVLFEGYVVSFTIRDIDRALLLLCGTGDSTFGCKSGLDTAKDYKVELFSGVRMEYRNRMQHIIQNGVGAFLLLSGHAYIENSKSKQLHLIIADIQEFPRGVSDAFIKFTDPKDGKRIFTGRMSADMYNRDLGID
jgi:hypothetical protein